MTLTLQDLERLQAEYPDYQMELVGGEIIVMSPSGYEPEEVAVAIASLLWNWVKPRKLGRVTGSSAGFILPNADVRAPDVSFVRAEKLPRSTENYAEVVPDLIVEVKSKTDSLKKLREKIQTFLSLGTRIGILVDPRTRILEVHRLGAETAIVQGGDILTLPDLLPGWEMPLSEIWAPEFE